MKIKEVEAKTAKVFKEGSPSYNDFLKFNAAIDEAIDKFGMSEDEAIDFVMRHWSMPEDVSSKDVISNDLFKVRTVEDMIDYLNEVGD